MSYSLKQIKNFAYESIKNIIPLDEESIDEMITYTLNNFKTREAISNHFLDILGESDLTFQFVSKFCDMLFGSTEEIKSSSMKTFDSKPIPQSISKPNVSKPPAKQKPKSSGIRLIKSVPASKMENNNSKGRMSNNTKNGATTSEMFDMKPTTIETQKIKNKEVKKKLNNIQDLDDVLLQLEIENSTTKDNDIRICNCNATRHPLYEMYPNCLNCGKIICMKEGFQPCSFCGHSLISSEEKMQMLEIINKEKEDLENQANKIDNVPKETFKNKKKNVIKISLNTTGQNNFKVQEQFVKQIEQQNKEKRELEEAMKQEKEMIDQNKKDLEYYNSIHKKDDELIKAEERLAMLLNFQEDGAERTKIIDHASDFELPTGGGSLWASPVERILQFKRQQKLQKKIQEKENQRSGRGATVMNMIIQNGEVVFQDKVEDSGLFENISDDEEVTEFQNKVNQEKLQQFQKDVRNVYDFDSFSKTLVKPVYNGHIDESSSETKEIIADLPVLGTVVQLGDAEQQEDQLFNMIGV
jgi:DNA repair exonuclease SbcCD ATPase subunit